jgi:DNA-binding MarR family transcriptional regulator
MATKSAGPPTLDDSPALRTARNAHINVLIASVQIADDLDRISKTEELTHAQYMALFVLCLHDDAELGVSTGAIADGLLNRAADTTRLVDRLVKTGLAERLQDERDRRLVLVRATTEGRRRFDHLTTLIHEYHQTEWANLDGAEVEQLDALLTKAIWGETLAE